MELRKVSVNCDGVLVRRAKVVAVERGQRYSTVVEGWIANVTLDEDIKDLRRLKEKYPHVGINYDRLPRGRGRPAEGVAPEPRKKVGLYLSEKVYKGMRRTARRCGLSLGGMVDVAIAAGLQA